MHDCITIVIEPVGDGGDSAHGLSAAATARKRGEVLLANGERASNVIVDLGATVICTGGRRNLLVIGRAK